MNSECPRYRSQIPEALLGDLDSESQQVLSRHLAECPACATEQALYAETFRQMRLAGDVEVPRHFFVYPQEVRENPWHLFRRLGFAWQGALATAAALLVLLAAVAVARVQIRTEGSAIIIGFGKLPVVQAPVPDMSKLYTASLEADILRVVEERSRKDNLELLRVLRAEIARSDRAISDRQRALLQTALLNLEERLGGRITETAATMQQATNRSLEEFYQTVSLQRESDMTRINNRISRIAVSGEAKSNQTDAILETLLQVAELRLK